MPYQVIVKPDRARADSYQITIAPDPRPGSGLGAVSVGPIHYRAGSGLYHLVRDGILNKLTPAPRGDVDSVARNVFGQLFDDYAEAMAMLEDEEELVIVEPRLGLPWEALHDGRNFLGLRFQLLRGLQLSAGIVGLSGPRESVRPESAVIILNPEGDPKLNTQAVADAHRALSSRLVDRGIRVSTVGPEATVGQVMENVIGADIVHYYGHVYTDTESGAYYIMCSDEPVGFADIARTARADSRDRPLELLFINGCAGAEVLYEVLTDIIDAGREVRVAIGSVVSEIAPDEALAFQIPLYEALLDGKTLGEAVLQARRAAHEAGHLTGALCYACYGDPATVLVGPPPPEELVRGRYDDTGWDVIRWSVHLAQRFDVEAVYSAILFLALLAIPESGLAEALAQQGADTHDLRNRLQKEGIGEPQAAGGPGGFEVRLSESVKRILNRAYEIAIDDSRDGASARDVARAFAECPSSTVAWLERNDIDIGRLQEQIEDAGHREIVTQEANDILRLAAKAAAAMGQRAVTSHSLLLAFLLAPPPAAGGFLQAFIPFAPFLIPVSEDGRLITMEEFRQRVRQIDDADAVDKVSASVRKALELARQAAREDERELLTGDDLWAGFVQVDTSQVYQFVEKELGFSLAGPYPRLFDAAGHLLLDRFDEDAKDALNEAFRETSSTRSGLVSTAHLLVGLLVARDSLLSVLVQAQGIDADAVGQAVRRRALAVGESVRGGGRLQWRVGCLSLRVMRIFNIADVLARADEESGGQGLITQAHLIRAFATDGGGETGALLQDQGVDLRELARQAEAAAEGEAAVSSLQPAVPALPGVVTISGDEAAELLDRPQLCGELVELLLTPTAVVAIVGAAGVGKSSLCPLLAQRLQAEDAPSRLRGTPVVRLSIGASVRPAEWLEDFFHTHGPRLQQLGAVLVLDGLEILASEQARRAACAAGQLGKALGMRVLLLMRPTLWEAVQTEAPELFSGVGRVIVPAMTEAEAMEVVKHRAAAVQRRDGVAIGEAVLSKIVADARQLGDVELPGAACQLLERAVAVALAAGREAVGAEEVETALARLRS